MSFYVVRKQKPLDKGASKLENKSQCVLLLADEEFLLIISIKKKKKNSQRDMLTHAWVFLPGNPFKSLSGSYCY